MGGDSCPQDVGLDLLQQLELILEHDKLIDEVGFIHPSQFALLNEGSGGLVPPSTKFGQSADKFQEKGIEEFPLLRYDKSVFWSSDHKLAISAQMLPQLYSAALHAYMGVSESYKRSIRSLINEDSSKDVLCEGDFDHYLESEILKHTRALLILSYDFKSAWNIRKLVLSRKHDVPLFIDEMQLSALILSYAPKSESAWSHRRWVINMIAKGLYDLQELVAKESELVKNIAEKSKMNYRAWNHRCWLVLYMTKSQVLDELNKSRKWAELHIADNSCFHYRRRLMLTTLQDNVRKQDGQASFNHGFNVLIMWKEELQWNKLLIQRYIGREALWIHRRFLSERWITYFKAGQQVNDRCLDAYPCNTFAVDEFLDEEFELLQACLNIRADEFDDYQSQAQLAASYILWISKKICVHEESKLLERLKKAGNIKALLTKNCPEKLLLWESLLD